MNSKAPLATDACPARANAEAMALAKCHGDPEHECVADTPFAWYEESPQNHGPVRRRLEEYELCAMVGGPRGEMSKGIVQLVRRAAAVGASRMGAALPVTDPTTAEHILRWHATCRLGMAIQRSSAEHLLERVCYAQEGGAWRTAYDAGRAQTGDLSGMADSYRDTFFSAASGTPWREVGSSPN